MKKILSLIAALVMYGGASVSAQGTYAVQSTETYTPGYEVSTVSNIKAYYMEEDDAGFNSVKKTQNWADANFANYVSSKSNGAKFTEGKVPTGAHLKFEPALDGVLIVGIQIDKNKKLCLVGPSLKKSMDYTYTLPDGEGKQSQTLTNDVIAVKSRQVLNRSARF